MMPCMANVVVVDLRPPYSHVEIGIRFVRITRPIVEDDVGNVALLHTITQDEKLVVALAIEMRNDLQAHMVTILFVMRTQDAAETLVDPVVHTLASQCADVFLGAAHADVNDVGVIFEALGEVRQGDVGRFEVLVIDRVGAIVGRRFIFGSIVCYDHDIGSLFGAGKYLQNMSASVLSHNRAVCSPSSRVPYLGTAAMV